jgi:hypothetical protein
MHLGYKRWPSEAAPPSKRRTALVEGPAAFGQPQFAVHANAVNGMHEGNFMRQAA